MKMMKIRFCHQCHQITKQPINEVTTQEKQDQLVQNNNDQN